jgi:hypothetical protein
VGSSGDDVSILERAVSFASGDETGDVSHVDHEKSTVLIGDGPVHRKKRKGLKK